MQHCTYIPEFDHTVQAAELVLHSGDHCGHIRSRSFGERSGMRLLSQGKFKTLLITSGMSFVNIGTKPIKDFANSGIKRWFTHSINDLETIKQKYETVVDSWKKGDVRKLYDLIVAELKTKMPKLYKELITDRNEKWLPMIDAYLETAQKEFILVGVGHLVGPEGIIEALGQNGYKVEKL